MPTPLRLNPVPSWLRLLLTVCLLLLPSPTPATAGLRILCSTFPIAQVTKNVTHGRAGVTVELMLPAQLGCPHDYALTPHDMQRLAQADVLVINGLGLEEFLGAPIHKANPKLTVIDSSAGVSEVMPYSAVGGEKDHDHHGHEHQGSNPHLFASPRLSATLATTIADRLAGLDPDGATLYRQNAATYAADMQALDRDLHALAATLTNRRIITQHGVFDYLARDLGLEVVAVVQAHPGQEPAAAEMLAIIKTARAKKAGAIFAEPQYPATVVQTIAKEAGIPAATLDPGASGPEDAGLDYLQTVMRRNMETLKRTLGGP